MNEHEKVKQFHEAMGVPVATKPTMPDEATRLLRCRLLLEETLEYIDACGVSVRVRGGYITPEQCFMVPSHEADLPAMAQENADVRYIAHGNDLAMGTDVLVFDEVHRANMAKVGRDGRVQRNKRGKALKPDGWTPPDVARVLREMEEEP